MCAHSCTCWRIRQKLANGPRGRGKGTVALAGSDRPWGRRGVDDGQCRGGSSAGGRRRVVDIPIVGRECCRSSAEMSRNCDNPGKVAASGPNRGPGARRSPSGRDSQAAGRRTARPKRAAGQRNAACVPYFAQGRESIGRPATFTGAGCACGRGSRTARFALAACRDGQRRCGIVWRTGGRRYGCSQVMTWRSGRRARRAGCR